MILSWFLRMHPAHQAERPRKDSNAPLIGPVAHPPGHHGPATWQADVQIAVPLTQPRANPPVPILLVLTPRQGRPRSITWWCAHQPGVSGGMTQSDARRERQPGSGTPELAQAPLVMYQVPLGERNSKPKPTLSVSSRRTDTTPSSLASITVFHTEHCTEHREVLKLPFHVPGTSLATPTPLGAFSVLLPAHAEPCSPGSSLARAVGC